MKIGYPLEDFDSSPFIAEDALFVDEDSDLPKSTVYDLYAVVNHYGSMGGGHYTAYAKHAESGSRAGTIVMQPLPTTLFYFKGDTRSTSLIPL